MYARSTTIHADPHRIDDCIRLVQDEVMPALVRLAGCIGLSMVCDRESGRCIVTSSWESPSAMHATTTSEQDAVQRAAAAVGERAVGIDEWEIAVMHRARAAGDGCCARITWTRSDPAVLARTLENLPLTLLPRIDDREGFCSLSLFADRRTGRCSATAVYENRHALEASRDEVVALREQLAEHMGMQITEVAEFELAIHHLRVPEVH